MFRKSFLFLSAWMFSFGMACQTPEFSLEVDPVMQQLLSHADTDGDKKITIEDTLEKPFWLVNEQDSLRIEGTYYLSNLLQELALADLQGKERVLLSLDKIKEAPSQHISRRIKNYFWDDLTRTIDRKGLQKIIADSKTHDSSHRLYVPATDTVGIHYFKGLQKDVPELEVIVLPEEISPEYVKSINDRPGLLALKIEDGQGVPFVVPGGRFNEMYGWDSYFEGIGLIIDGRTDLAKAMVDNFIYQIHHYGKILNANRSYYLTRTQPPFLTSFIREVYRAMEKKDQAWLLSAVEAAIKEYETVWMVKGSRLVSNGLNRYYAQGVGIPPETEPGHFKQVLQEFAAKHKLPVSEFIRRYQSGRIQDPAVDTYFLHDRSMRESGHDTSWRLERKAAALNPVGLNSLLYKYEKDLEFLINTFFEGQLVSSTGKTYSGDYWGKKASTRKKLMNQYMWNEEKGSFFDYDLSEEHQTSYVSATNYYPLWAGLATKEQAERMQENLLRELKAKGGILASARSSVERVATEGVERQWDYPFGWAPHQMLLWRGLLNYGYHKEARELIYRWLWMITRNAVDYNGTIPEKYNVVAATHKVYAEYGNVGTAFDYITTSGFGWMNASYQLGLALLPQDYVEKLDRLVPPEVIF